MAPHSGSRLASRALLARDLPAARGPSLPFMSRVDDAVRADDEQLGDLGSLSPLTKKNLDLPFGQPPAVVSITVRDTFGPGRRSDSRVVRAGRERLEQ